MTTKKFYEPSEISVADFKKNLAKLEEKITKILVPWKCILAEPTILKTVSTAKLVEPGT